MEFKMISLSEIEVGRIAGNAGTHAELMSTDLTARWRSLIPEDQKVIDIHQVQMCVRHDLHRLRKKIAEIEDRHVGRIETEILSREVRNETIPQLRGQLIGIYNLFEGNFGAGTSTKVFGPRVTTIPLDAVPLRRLGKRAQRRLTDPGLVLPVSQLGGVKIVPRDLAKSFERPLAKLDQVLGDLEDTLPATNATLEEKIRTLADLRREAGIGARFLEALYFLAGHDEIARRVRQSSHRSRRVDGPPGVEATGQPPVAATAGGEQQGSPEAAVAEAGSGQQGSPDAPDAAATAAAPGAVPADEETGAGSPATAEAA